MENCRTLLHLHTRMCMCGAPCWRDEIRSEDRALGFVPIPIYSCFDRVCAYA